MSTPSTLPVSHEDPNQRSTDIQVPITDINVDLITRMRDAARGAGLGEWGRLSGDPTPYVIGPGDVLQITVWDHPELAASLGAQPQVSTRSADPAAGFVIDQDGNLTFPYVGVVHVDGMQPAAAQKLVAEKLSKVFIKPQVTLRIASFRSKQVYVDGEVRTPGPQSINDIPMTVYEAINRAGGFATTADQGRLVLVRGEHQYPLNLPQLLANGKNPSRIILKNGDLLRVMSRDDNGIFVMGEVNKPATAVPMKNGRLSLSDALSQAGSLNTGSADAAQLYVIRATENTAHPQVYHLDARSPVSMVLANQFDLEPKDVVYVDGNGLVRFSRILSLLLPAINAGFTAAVVTK